MNINNVKKVLPVLIKHRVVPFIWGSQGIGKTQTVKQIAKEQDMEFIHLHLATQEVGDLVGLLIKTDEGNVKHACPQWLEKTQRPNSKGIVFLDEFNRAHPDVLQVMFPFLTEGAIHTHKLGEGWRIVAAGNYNNNKFNVTDTSDAALLSRFCHIDFRPEIAEFVVYAENIGLDDIASFIRDNPKSLEVVDKEGLDKNFISPDRRAYIEMLGRLYDENLGDNEFEVYEGCIGTAAAAAYIAHKKKKEKSISANDVLLRYPKVQARVQALGKDGEKTGEVRFDVLGNTVDEILHKLELNERLLDTEDKVLNLQSFLLDIPLELVQKTFRWMNEKYFLNRESIVGNEVFLKKCFAGSKR